MRILHIAQSLLGGGVQNFLVSLLPEQVKMGHEVGLVVIDRYTRDYCHKLEHVFTDNGVKVFLLNKKVGNKTSFIKTVIKAIRITRHFKPDIVNSHTNLPDLYGSLVTAFTKAKLVITIHNGPEIWGLANKILNRNTPLIFCSQSAFELRTQKNKNIIAIDNGISEKIVKTDKVIDLRKELGLDADAKIIVSVGSLRPQKNYELLMSIVDELKQTNIHFCICGGNYGVGYIDVNKFSKYNCNIHFLGLRSDVSAIENGADLFLSCSTFEGLPIAVLEAFFNGIPCVLSPIPQHEKIAKGVYATYIPQSFNGIGFVETILFALKQTENHGLIYQKRKACIEKFSISETAMKYIAFYEKQLQLDR